MVYCIDIVWCIVLCNVWCIVFVLLSFWFLVGVYRVLFAFCFRAVLHYVLGVLCLYRVLCLSVSCDEYVDCIMFLVNVLQGSY